MKDEEFSAFATFLHERSGIVLTRDKEYLLESRLLPVARRHGHASLAALYVELKAAKPALVKDVVEAMTTNESFFFRDVAVFDRFRNLVIPALVAARAREQTIRIWSAASSSGQELYSLAMMLSEEGTLPKNWKIELLGTDLSTQMVERARTGLYNHFEVQRGLPIRYLKKYFVKDGENWRIDAALRERVKFRPYNLLDDYAVLGGFDVIFCRNVLIYFDARTKRDILDRMSVRLSADGYLFLGGAETVMGVSDRFAAHPGSPGVYVHAAPAPSRLRASA